MMQMMIPEWPERCIAWHRIARGIPPEVWALSPHCFRLVDGPTPRQAAPCRAPPRTSATGLHLYHSPTGWSTTTDAVLATRPASLHAPQPCRQSPPPISTAPARSLSLYTQSSSLHLSQPISSTHRLRRSCVCLCTIDATVFVFARRCSLALRIGARAGCE